MIRHLLSTTAIGAVTTHDLTLADTEELREHTEIVHFRERLDDAPGSALTFDYRLRPGLATSTNALKLLRLMGLSGSESPESVPPA